MQILRGVEDAKAFEKGVNNVTNAFDMMLLYRAIARNQVVDSSACATMIGILLWQKFKDKIPALLPDSVRVAHKTGNITGVEHDAGIVFLPIGRAYVVALLSKNLKDARAGKSVLAQVSKKLYDYFSIPK